MGLFSFLYERVFHIQIYGGINHRMTEHLVKALRYKNLYSVQLIAVSINSIGGSLTQAKNINAILKNLSNKTGAPVYTFAEDACLHTANAILAAGNKSFANEFSIIGDYAFHLENYGVKGLLDNYGVRVDTLASGEQKDRLNMFEDLREKDKKWVQHLLYEGEYELKSEVLKYRSNSFQQLRLSNENVEEKIFAPPVLTSKAALQNGVIDGIATLDKILHERYPDVKVAEIMKGFTNTQSPKHSAQAVNTVSSMFQLKH